MNEFNRLIKDNVIDKGKLIIKRSSFLDVDKVQAQFISKLFSNENIDFSNLTIKDIAKTISISDESAEIMTKDLISKGLIGIVKSNSLEYRFNYDLFIDKLIESYIAPNSNSSVEKKVDWTTKTLDINFSNSNINDLRKIIEANGWENLKLVIQKLLVIDNPTWHQLISMYESLGVKDNSKETELKKILDKNWLED